MAFTSTTPVATVLDQHFANVHWQGDVAMARLRYESVDWLLTMRPVSGTQAGRSQAFDYQALKDEAARLMSFINIAGNPNRVTFIQARPVGW